MSKYSKEFKEEALKLSDEYSAYSCYNYSCNIINLS